MSFIYIPEILEPILRNVSSSTRDLSRCSLVDRQFARQTKPLLEHAALRESASPCCADWQRQCRLKNWAICEATLLSSGVCLKVSGRKKRAAMRRKSRRSEERRVGKECRS